MSASSVFSVQDHTENYKNEIIYDYVLGANVVNIRSCHIRKLDPYVDVEPQLQKLSCKVVEEIDSTTNIIDEYEPVFKCAIFWKFYWCNELTMLVVVFNKDESMKSSIYHPFENFPVNIASGDLVMRQDSTVQWHYRNFNGGRTEKHKFDLLGFKYFTMPILKIEEENNQEMSYDLSKATIGDRLIIRNGRVNYYPYDLGDELIIDDIGQVFDDYFDHTSGASQEYPEGCQYH